jgi:ferredoxin-NADP reductase/Na+-translocating ferredoxin:NAD+ oxidoreductase RnfD subunit
MKFIDNILDKITMYRLVLYYLILLLVVASIFGFFGILPYSPISIIVSTIFLVVICWITNKIFSYAFDAPTNLESVYISALILALILSPIKSTADIPLLFWAAVLTMASKYILAINKVHIFNPVAIAVVLTAIGFGGSASWWIGTASLLPFSLLGFFIVRKIRRYDLVFYFFVASLITMFGLSMVQGSNVLTTLQQIVISSPIFFFAFIMLTEPLTTPPTKSLQAVYGALVGVLFAPQFHIGSFYTTPEIALVIGNIFSYTVSPKFKLILTVKDKIKVGYDTIDFIFTPKQKFSFSPGQYMEWTLSHNRPDSRGNRRYFTIASSPTEENLRLGVKFYANGSSYKKALLLMDNQRIIVGAQARGDFTLPKDPKEKLVFMAGGIGITPFRSMIKYLIDTKQPRPIIVLYANKTIDEIVYYDVLNHAQQQLGIRTIYTLTEKTKIPATWQGSVGRIDENMIVKEIPDFMERIFYLSGPRMMVTSYEKTLRKIGVPEKHIKIDFFPGLV